MLCTPERRKPMPRQQKPVGRRTNRQTQSNGDERKRKIVTLKHLKFCENFARSPDKSSLARAYALPNMQQRERADDVSTNRMENNKRKFTFNRKQNRKHFHQNKCTRTVLTGAQFVFFFPFAVVASSVGWFVWYANKCPFEENHKKIASVASLVSPILSLTRNSHYYYF